jgi:hypothetical protein
MNMRIDHQQLAPFAFPRSKETLLSTMQGKSGQGWGRRQGSRPYPPAVSTGQHPTFFYTQGLLTHISALPRGLVTVTTTRSGISTNESEHAGRTVQANQKLRTTLSRALSCAQPSQV